jgi:hypothetical protein
MAGRPKGIASTWATDAAWVDVGQPWNGAAPTLEPSTGKKKQGFLPNERWNARYINWELGDVSSRTEAYDFLESNFVEFSSIVFSPAEGPLDFVRDRWSGLPALYCVGGATKIHKSKDDGYSWVDDYTVGGALFRRLAASRVTSIGAIYELAGAGLIALTGSGPGGVWGSQALTASTEARALKADALNSCYWVGGRRTNIPGLWRVNDTNGTTPATVVTTYHPAASNTIIDQVAVSPTYVLASGNETGTSLTKLWRATIGTPGAAAAIAIPDPSGTTIPIVALEWHSQEGLFMCCKSDGSTSIWYSSVDGSSWSTLATISNEVLINTLSILGSSMLCVFRIGGATGDYYLAWSTDAAASWNYKAAPLGPFGGLNRPTKTKIVDNRFFVNGQDSGGEIRLARSLRIGR